MDLADLETWSRNKDADVVFDICICGKWKYFGFKILATPEHRFMIDWGDGSKYIGQGDGNWRSYSYDYHENDNTCSCRVAIYADAGCEILGLDLPGDIYERYVTHLDTSRCLSLRELRIEEGPALDLSCNRHLKVLRCELPLFDNLDIGSNAELEELYIRGSGRNMKFLDVSGCPNLKALTCQTMDIEHLYLESNTELEELDVRSCLKFLAILKRLNFQGAVSGFCLPIGCYFRPIAWLSSFEKRGKIPRNFLPMPQTNKFKQLLNGCYNLKLLDVSACRKLRHLECSGCEALAEIKLPDPAVLECVLEKLDVNKCYNLKSLDLSTCRKLSHLNCSGCEALTEIKLPDPTVLEYVLYDDSGIVGRKEDWFLKCLLNQKK